eukprot:scaffold988_cov393-Pavlova_lutheri.AAC.6
MEETGGILSAWPSTAYARQHPFHSNAPVSASRDRFFSVPRRSHAHLVDGESRRRRHACLVDVPTLSDMFSSLLLGFPFHLVHGYGPCWKTAPGIWKLAHGGQGTCPLVQQDGSWTRRWTVEGRSVGSMQNGANGILTGPWKQATRTSCEHYSVYLSSSCTLQWRPLFGDEARMKGVIPLFAST